MVYRCVPNDDDENDHRKHDEDNQNNKVEDFSLQSRHASLGLVRQFSDAAKDSLVSCGHDNTKSTARNAMSPLHADAASLKVIVIG